MKMLVRVFAFACLLGLPSRLLAQGATVPKTNPIPVYVQIMPWFQTPETLGGTNWGWHWTMNDRNPNIIDSNGQREIASYYYPLIGTYDSSDPYVIEDQMLLMKLSGISGTIVDWYGQQGSNSDEASLLSASNKIVSATQTYGLGVGVCLEDRFATSESEVTNNINYMEQNYATQSNYLTVGPSKNPMTLLFGPITYQTPSDWTSILSGVNKTPALVPLQYQSYETGAPPAVGEAGWIYQDKGQSDDLTVQQNFLANEAGKFSNSIGDAYVGYNDYYTAGGDPSAASGFVIPESDANGPTLTETLDQDQTYSKNISAIQIATWNDYGEGTMIEPTVQNGFSSLQQIQKFTGVPYGLSQLQLVYQLYEAREQFLGNTTEEGVLSQTANDINQLDFPDAEKSLADAVTSTSATISLVNSLTLNGTAAFNLTNDKMIISYAAGADPIATIRSYLNSGYNNGNWNGLGIDSSNATANSSYALGYADSADAGNPAGLLGDTIEIMYTLLGDANLDGKVNGADFTLMATNFNQSGRGWDQGDFNYDGAVNGDDFVLLANNFNQYASQSSVSAADLAALDSFADANGISLANVPEPACTAMMAIAGFAILRRRQNS
jgi:Glycosyl hydrolase family 99